MSSGCSYMYKFSLKAKQVQQFSISLDGQPSRGYWGFPPPLVKDPLFLILFIPYFILHIFLDKNIPLAST